MVTQRTRLAAAVLAGIPHMAGLMLFLLPASVLAMTRKDEVEIGRTKAKALEVLCGLSADTAQVSRVERIGARIVSTLPQSMYPYQFRVLADPTINACACPGGFIFINHGLAAALGSDEALAFVIAHEIAHAANRHHAQWQAKMDRVKVLSSALSAAVGDTQLELARLVVKLTDASYSRDNERGADAAAVRYMRQAGYDTRGAIEALEFLARLDTKARSGYLDSHPPPAHRIELVKSLIERQEGENAGKQSVTPSEPMPAQVDLAVLVGSLPDATVSANPYLPLAVGREWHYVVQASGITLQYEVRIAARIPVPGGDVFRLETTMGDVITYSQVFTTASTVWLRHRPNEQESPWSLEWILTDDATQFQPRDGWNYTLIGKEELSLPCGRFTDVIHVRKRQADDGNAGADAWYGANIGMLKRVDARTGFVELLQSYKVEMDPGSR